jgi:hypothetical protein
MSTHELIPRELHRCRQDESQEKDIRRIPRDYSPERGLDNGVTFEGATALHPPYLQSQHLL